MHMPCRVVAVDTRIQHQCPPLDSGETARSTEASRATSNDDNIVVSLNSDGSRKGQGNDAQ